MDLKTYTADGPRGTATQLAKLLGVSPSYLSQMAAGQAPISPQRAVEIEVHTHGAVTRKDLFPNDWHRIWPELAEQAPDSSLRESKGGTRQPIDPTRDMT